MTGQLSTIIDETKIIRSDTAPIVQALIAASCARASMRFLDFFATQIRK
jgi:hypothetical protein